MTSSQPGVTVIPRMTRRFPPFLFCAFAASACAAGTPPVYSRASLVERPVFASSGGGLGPDSGGPPEVRGFFGPSDAPEVSLRRPGTGRSCWVRVGESFDGWVVESADAETGRVVLGASGSRLALALMKESFAAPSSPGAPAVGEAGAPDDAGRQNRVEAGRKFFRDGLADLRAAHPEYFGPGATPDQLRALAEARARLRENARRISDGEPE